MWVDMNLPSPQIKTALEKKEGNLSSKVMLDKKILVAHTLYILPL